MQKTDLSKEQKHYYRSKPNPELVTIAAANYLAVEGSGDPAAAPFSAKIKALYAAAYNAKKICKLQGNDFKVPALEGLWWTPGGEQLTEVPKQEWYWKLLIQLPAFVTVNDCKQATALAGNKKLPYLDQLGFERFPATLAVQLLHTGSYHDETPSLQKLYGYIDQHALEASSPHREVYITDPNKTPAERLKTILRVDVRSK
ncbi:GyrI-like domain-containing protein [Chitinophaga alhagiae]|nr:GyrI-like domain-containing protein [Chitinophaga alhagiae]